jgi:uncharacterized membrane protein (DUF4010 family)
VPAEFRGTQQQKLQLWPFWRAAAGIGYLTIAAALYAWTVLLLIEKSELHALADRIGVIELEAAAQFGAMALIVLPLLPSGNYGPRGVLNFRSVWLLVLVF